MPRPLLPVVLPAVLLAVLATAAHGQETETPDRLYQVEVIVFEQTGETAESLLLPERLEPEAGVPGTAPAGEGGSGDEPGSAGSGALPPGPAGETEPGEPEPGAFLPERFGGPLERPRLDGIVRRLGSAGYRVIWHQAWTQPASRRAADRPVGLPVLAALGGGPATGELSGAVQLSAGRYLHLGLELEVPAPGGEDYTLAQRRRVKLNDLNYFDHPRLGAITLVTVPEVPSAADDAGEPGL